jgi:H2-forming N5,N10-methylenetetrahydromethanopterin dehydrogenase-like enzyme
MDQIGPKLTGDGVVAIAHPSTIPIGETHGVYVLSSKARNSNCWASSCLEVLQKPKRKLMEEKGALFCNGIIFYVYVSNLK